MLNVNIIEPLTGKYPWHRNITATVFWVGEGETKDNDFISNAESIWDKNWQSNFGGVDDPDERTGFYPNAFVPRENPFYIALPYNDLVGGKRKESAKEIPWYDSEILPTASQLKNRWVKIKYEGKDCFAQWEDVGPFEIDDFDYVFGDKLPQNKFGVHAGIDISPAVRDCLGVGDVTKVDWKFIDFENVPKGPWKEIVTKD